MYMTNILLLYIAAREVKTTFTFTTFHWVYLVLNIMNFPI